MSKSAANRWWQPVVACLGLVLGASPAPAHHSTAEFDYRKTVILTGTIVEVQWLNPHSYIEILVPDKDGKLIRWSIEYGTPNVNVRMGWRRDSIKQGDRVTLNVAPTRDGKPRGTLRVLTFRDGRQLQGVAARVGVDKNGFATFGPQAGTPAAANGGGDKK